MVPRGTEFQVIVVGAGHAGCEAALACARLGLATCLVTSNPERLAEMSCNPAIGGLGKSQIVREIDALGGEMGRAADAAAIHFRRLNQSKGPAVRARRVQCDMGLYHKYMYSVVDECDGLHLLSGCVAGLLSSESGEVNGVVLESGERLGARAVVLTTGTFLGGLMHTGSNKSVGGRVGDVASDELSLSLARMGLTIARFKTGTPARIWARSIDFDGLEVQPSDDLVLPFSHEASPHSWSKGKSVVCYFTRTNENTHEIIRSGIPRSPLFSGVIKGLGPRYCPSIEDKVVRFPDRSSHQVVLEPLDLSGELIYPNGISTSLPLDVQTDMVRSIEGLESAEIAQAGYAVEYDVLPPQQLDHRLAVKNVPGLFLAGQINGTSGYEEAAGQGLWAGINAAAQVLGKGSFILSRVQAYLGVMVDDLVTRGTSEPYRMFSSRAEFRLLLREDNALARLTDVAEAVGLVPRPVLDQRRKMLEQVESLLRILNSTLAEPEKSGRRPSLARLLRRPEICVQDVVSRLDGEYHRDVLEQVEVRVKYEGYVQRQMMEAEKLMKLSSRTIPEDMDFFSIPGLSRELAQKLSDTRPVDFHTARAVDGMTPAALSVISLFIDRANVPRGTSAIQGAGESHE